MCVCRCDRFIHRGYGYYPRTKVQYKTGRYDGFLGTPERNPAIYLEKRHVPGFLLQSPRLLLHHLMMIMFQPCLYRSVSIHPPPRAREDFDITKVAPAKKQTIPRGTLPV
jgi:hypothetical protein